MSEISVHDVAAYILGKLGPMSAMKLQKLVYYSQAWHLVWAEERLFPERIQAWANGPVVYELFNLHRGQFMVHTWPEGDPANLTRRDRGTIDAILSVYGDLDARQLSALTHDEAPWSEAREGLPPTAGSSQEITPDALYTYYSAIDLSPEATPVDQIDWTSWEIVIDDRA